MEKIIGTIPAKVKGTTLGSSLDVMTASAGKLTADGLRIVVSA